MRYKFSGKYALNLEMDIDSSQTDLTEEEIVAELKRFTDVLKEECGEVPNEFEITITTEKFDFRTEE
jgi:hypothetical protein